MAFILGNCVITSANPLTFGSKPKSHEFFMAKMSYYLYGGFRFSGGISVEDCM